MYLGDSELLPVGYAPDDLPVPHLNGVDAGGGRAGDSQSRASARSANVGDDDERADPTGAGVERVRHHPY
jgi:hypothetical protein